jgi:adenylate cyclase
MLKDVLLEVNDETKVINSTNFNIDVTRAVCLPSLDDSDITFEIFDNMTKRAKVVATCVLYVDIRKSTRLNFEHNAETLSKLYSSFIRGTIKCAMHFSGKVRNIIGDRVMILFDPENCFANAVKTAILLNTFSNYILNRHFKDDSIQCGIGIDYGPMLATKTGTIKRESDSYEYKSLVWLGQPANVASKLADIANKRFFRTKVRLEQYNPFTYQWHTTQQELEEFFDSLELTYSYPIIARFREPYWNVLRFFKTLVYNSYSPILMTKAVYDGFSNSCPQEESVRGKWWKPRKVKVGGYNGIVYQGGVFFTFGKELT